MGASIISIILFVIYTWGFGNLISLFAKESEDWLERTVMRVGVGLSAIILLATIMNMLKIPLHWWIFLILAIIFPIISFIKNKKINLPNLKLTKKNIIYILLILLFAFNLYTYTKGRLETVSFIRSRFNTFSTGPSASCKSSIASSKPIIPPKSLRS